MNQFLKNAFVLFALFSSISLYAQKENDDAEKTMPIQPMFSFGTAYHSFQGDIMGPATNSLLGNMGYRAGMRLNISKNKDVSLLFSNTSFFEENDSTNFKSNVDAIGLHLGYTLKSIFKQSRISPYLNVGLQSLSFKTYVNDEYWTDRESIIAIPLGLGLRLNLSERIDLDATFNYTIAMGDIDKSAEENADKFMSASFTIHYDLFTPSKKVDDDYFDDSYYADVDFAKLESEDEDGDLIRDLDDYCPKTPIGVKVDANGCPLDDDKDGIANYLDQQKNTPKGSIIDENGVRLTADKYHSMYSDFEVASRKYANFYNEVEIKRENYKTVDEYLIAQANAFNKAYNEGKNDNSEVTGLIYKVKIGEFRDGIPAKIANQLLSIDDLESFTMDDDAVIYAIGSYTTLDEAMNRLYAIEEKGFDDTYIIVDNNGEISNYVADPNPNPEIKEEEVLLDSDEEVETNEAEVESIIVKEVDEPINETTYRIQIGAFSKPLSNEVFVGVNNVIFFTGKDGLVRYMTGSFNEYKDAIDYQAQMKARGFDDAFIVTYKNGERISLNIAIKTENTNSVVQEKESNEVAIDLKFTVQIMVTKALVSPADLKKMSKLGNIDKEESGSLYKYFSGIYSDFESANLQLEKAKLAGYIDAFIFANLDGKRITLEQAKELLK